MRQSCDSHGEMPTPRHLDELAAESLLQLSAAELDGDDALARFFQDLRDVVDQKAPAPTPELARVFRSGFSTHSIAPLVAGADSPSSNRAAIRPRPKEKHPAMRAKGIFRGVPAKVLVVASTLLVGVSTAAAAGALPTPAQHAVAAAVHSITPVELPGVNTNATTSANVNAKLPVAGNVTAGVGANVNTGTSGGTASGAKANASVSAGANAKVAGNTAGVSAGVTAGAGANTGKAASTTASTALSTVAKARAAMTSCLSSVINATGQPLMALGTIVPTLLACVKSAIGTLPIPSVASSCVSGLLNSLGSLPVIGSGTGQINLAGCLPIDLSTCLQAALGAVGGVLTGSLGLGTLPTTIATCASSIVNGVLNLLNNTAGQATGTLGHLSGVGASVSVNGSAKAHSHHRH